MADDRHLRAVPSDEDAGHEAAEEVPRRRRPSWPILIVSGALVVALLLLAGSGVWFGRRLDALEAEAAALRAAVERRDLVIEAQRARLDDVRSSVDDVRSRVENLRALLAEPLPEPD